jgi:hypothetical protein
MTGSACVMLIGVVVTNFGLGEPLNVKLLNMQFRRLRAQFLRFTRRWSWLGWMRPQLRSFVSR